jgi:predicted HD phosphohydrolase
MSAAADWRLRVAELREKACSAEHVREASEYISQAFALIEREGDERDLIVASVLCLAGDVAMAANEVEPGAALYNRASEVARACGPVGNDMLAKALRGLADADVVRGWTERAVQRYAESLVALERSNDPEANALRAEVEAALRSLPR